MSDDVQASAPITQSDIDTVVARLDQLRGRIAQIQRDIKRLKEHLQRITQEYHLTLDPLLSENRQLRAEIQLLQDQIDEGQDEDTSIYAPLQGYSPRSPDGMSSGSVPPAPADPEAQEKQALTRYLARVLDHLTSENDASIFSQVQGVVANPTARLADALELVPWDIWKTRAPNENLAKQYRRLIGWERSLTAYLQTLEGMRDHLDHDRLWEIYQGGEERWQQFIQQLVTQEQRTKGQCTRELQRLKAIWEDMVNDV